MKPYHGNIQFGPIPTVGPGFWPAPHPRVYPKANPSQVKWDNRFLDLAKLVASWSKDESSRVGSCIVDANNRVVSIGYNGPPQGVKDGFVDRDQKLRRTLHAETNAILFANKDITGCALYVTHPPCARCAAMIIQRGIARVVFITPAPGFAERWAEDMKEAKSLFAEAGVKVTGYASPSDCLTP